MLGGAFENRSFQKLLTGQVITNIGDSLYYVGALWLVHELGNDPIFTGIAGFLVLVPRVFQFLVGPIVDNYSLTKILIASQLSQAALVLAIPLAEFLGVLSLPLVLIVMPLLAIINKFANPAMVTMLPRLFDGEELAQANSATSAASEGVDMIADGIAGVLVGIFGAVTLFAFDSVTFLVATVLFVSMKIPTASTGSDAEKIETQPDDSKPATDGGGSDASKSEDDGMEYLREIREGYEFIRGTLVVPVLLTALSVNIVGGILVATLPAFAETLQVPVLLQSIGAAGAFGLLSSGYAAGSFLGIIGINLILDKKMGLLLISSFVVAGLLWTAAVLTGSFTVTMAFIILAFMPIGGVNILIQTFIQSYPPEDLVGRVTSLFESIMVSTIPIGSLIGGAAASAFGVRPVLIGVGGWLVIVGVVASTRSDIRTLPAVDNISEAA